LYPSDHIDFKGNNCLQGNNSETIFLAHSIFFCENRAFVVDLPQYQFVIIKIIIKVTVVMIQTDQIQYLSRVIRSSIKKQTKPS